MRDLEEMIRRDEVNWVVTLGEQPQLHLLKEMCKAEEVLSLVRELQDRGLTIAFEDD